MTIGGATNAEIFHQYVREILLPKLRPGDIVIMDNLSAHKSSKALDVIQSVGADVQFLPAYSPDLNPIELMWSKAKGLLRKAQARCADSLLGAIRMALDEVSVRDAAGWFAHCGYAFV